MTRLLPLTWLVLLGCPQCPAQDSARVATWSGDRAGAFAFTFDDGYRQHVTIAAPMLDALGLKATFAINPGKTSANGNTGNGTWDDWRALARGGHEIANHSMTHPNLSQVADAATLEQEIVGAQAIIEKQLGQPCSTFVYPFNAESAAARALVRKSHSAWTGGERKAYGGPDFTTAKANAWIDEAIAQRSLIVAMIHGIDGGYLPFANRAVLKDHLDYAKAHEAQVWIAPLGVIRRYAAEREVATLAVKGGPGTAVISLTTTLDATAYAVPLTVVIASGAAMTVSARRAGGGAIPARIVGDHLLCDVVPGPGAVTVSWK